MPRPTIDDEVLARLEAIVDTRTKVSAEHLTTTQRLDFVLDELEEADGRADRLADRVAQLEERLEEATQTAEDPAIGDGQSFNLGGANNRF